MMESRIYVKKSSSKNGQSNDNYSAPSKPKMKIVSGESYKDRDSHKPPSRNARVEPHLHLLQKYSNYNWDGLDINDLYNDFKEIEKNLKNLLDNDYKQSTHVVSDFASLKEHFVLIWEKILFMDINYACGKEIDKRLWFIIKKPIESLNKDKKKEKDVEEKLLKIIDSNITIIKEIIQKISSKLDIQNTPITEDNAIRKIASNLMSYLGELFQTREKVTASNPTYNDSVGVYFRASSLYPYEGKYFMLISNCSKLNKDLFGAVYWGMRAYCCTNFYPMNEQLLKYLEEARLAYLEMLEREWLDVRTVELFKYFILSFLRYLNIILTKIGFEELNGVTSKMFEYLQKYINHLVASDADPKVLKPTEGSLVQQTVMLMIYSLYNSVQGYDPRNDLKEKYLEAQGKSFAALASNDLAKETLRYSYGIMHHLLDLLLAINDDNYLSTFSPLLYYLAEHKSVADYLFSAYKQLKDKFISFNKKLTEWYKKKCQEISITNEEIEEILESNAFTTDKLLFGFVPLIPYFLKNRTCHKKLIPQDKQHIARMKDIINMLNDLGCRFVDKSDPKSETKEDILSLEGFPSLGEEAKSHTTAFGDMLRNKENKEKNPIVLDGQNVAIRYGDTRFSSMGLKLAIDFWVERGHQVFVMLPDYYFKKEEVAMKRQLAESKGESLKHIPDDVDLLVDLKAKGYAYAIPNWNYDDSYIIDYAKKKGAYIVTNDRYNDHIEKYSKNDQNLKKKLRDWVRNNCISFTFIGNDFMPNPDFLNEHMK